MLKITAVATAALALLVGSCSSDSDDADEETTTTTTSRDEGSTVVAPVIVDAADDVTVEVGEVVVVSNPNATEVTTDDAGVLEVSQAYSDGSAEFNAGAEAVAAGSATLSVFEGDQLLYEVNVTVQG